jgi:hypothetical protein
MVIFCKGVIEAPAPVEGDTQPVLRSAREQVRISRFNMVVLLAQRVLLKEKTLYNRGLHHQGISDLHC